MTNAVAADFRTALAARLESVPQMLAARWLVRLEELIPVDPNQIFPGDELLGQMPELIRQIAAFLRAPAEEAIAANALVTAKARELGRLRHAQRASIHQVLREYRILRTVIAEFIEQQTQRLRLMPAVAELFELGDRLDLAIEVLRETTLDTFVAEYTETITKHAASLESFNRMVTHELRQPLGTLQFAVKLLGASDAWTDAGSRGRLLATAERNVERMSETLAKLVALSRAPDGSDNALVQRMELAAMVADVVTQLREMAEVRGVEIRPAAGLPAVRVDVARLELVLLNLVSNAIKYSDPDKPARFVEIAAVAGDRADAFTLAVRDNGLGIPESEQRSVFARFFRGHAERDTQLGTDGLGLGLSIVADCVDSLRGSIRVDSTPGEGTTFFVDLPSTVLD